MAVRRKTARKSSHKSTRRPTRRPIRTQVSTPTRSAALAPASGARIVLVTAPHAVAPKIAEDLVRRGIAACVNVLPGVRSVYRWKGRIEKARESLLLVKTTVGRGPALAARLAATHPYEVPEYLAIGPSEGLSSYLTWLRGS